MSGSIWSIDHLFDNVSDDEVQQTKALRRVADIARNLWKTDPGSPDLDLVAQRVGDAARVESNRTPLGESGLLDFFCSVVSTQGLRSTLIVQCLRIIGNSSADKDENRERVLTSGCLPSVISLLNDDAFLALVIPVLFNISVDYEPAHKAMYQAGINPELVSLLSGPSLEDAPVLVNYVCKLLGFVATQEPEASLVHPATPFVLLSLADDQPLPLDAKDFLALASVALTYLAQEQFQQAFLETPGSIPLLFRTFSTACDSIDASEDCADDEAQLKQVQTVFTATLADLSAQPLFASSCSLDGPEVRTLQGWISAPHIPLQSAACLALGNVARSDDKCSYLVQKLGIHKPLITILADPINIDAGLLHSVLGFLKNLAIPAENKPILGEAGLLETDVLPRIWDLDTQTQVQFDAVSLTRLLLVGCAANVRRICAPLSEDPASRSKLHLLIDLNARSDQEPTQMETARAITAVCRALHSGPDARQGEVSTPPFTSTPNPSIPPNAATIPPTPPSTSGPAASPENQHDPDLAAFYADHGTLTDAMLRLGQQSKFPVLRSELLFVFALMARTPAGAAAVARSMHRPEPVAMIEEVVTGAAKTTTTTTAPDAEAEAGDEVPSSTAPSPLTDISIVAAGLEARVPATAATPGAQKSKTMHDIDRENALVLVTQLLQRCPDVIPADPRQRFQTLLREGGRLLLQERAEARASS
ncbi:armadillo-type protein [Nemania serpens]|nr:armadillo-type protein [Nemania serpens]